MKNLYFNGFKYSTFGSPHPQLCLKNNWNPVSRTEIKEKSRHPKHLHHNQATFQIICRSNRGYLSVSLSLKGWNFATPLWKSLRICDGISFHFSVATSNDTIFLLPMSALFIQRFGFINWHSWFLNTSTTTLFRKIWMKWNHWTEYNRSHFMGERTNVDQLSISVRFRNYGDTANGSIKTIQHDIPSEVFAWYACMQFYWMAKKVCTKSEIIMENHHRQWP